MRVWDATKDASQEPRVVDEADEGITSLSCSVWPASYRLHLALTHLLHRPKHGYLLAKIPMFASMMQQMTRLLD